MQVGKVADILFLAILVCSFVACSKTYSGYRIDLRGVSIDGQDTCAAQSSSYVSIPLESGEEIRVAAFDSMARYVVTIERSAPSSSVSLLGYKVTPSDGNYRLISWDGTSSPLALPIELGAREHIKVDHPYVPSERLIQFNLTLKQGDRVMTVALTGGRGSPIARGKESEMFEIPQRGGRNK